MITHTYPVCYPVNLFPTKQNWEGFVHGIVLQDAFVYRTPVISWHRYSIVRPFANSFTVHPTLWPTIGAISLRTLHGSTPKVTETTHRCMIPQLPAFPFWVARPRCFSTCQFVKGVGRKRVKRTGFEQANWRNNGRVVWAFRSQPTTHSQTMSNWYKLFKPPNFSDFRFSCIIIVKFGFTCTPAPLWMLLHVWAGGAKR